MCWAGTRLSGCFQTHDIQAHSKATQISESNIFNESNLYLLYNSIGELLLNDHYCSNTMIYIICNYITVVYIVNR